MLIADTISIWCTLLVTGSFSYPRMLIADTISIQSTLLVTGSFSYPRMLIADTISIWSTLLVAGRELEFFLSQDALHRIVCSMFGLWYLTFNLRSTAENNEQE